MFSPKSLLTTVAFLFLLTSTAITWADSLRLGGDAEVRVRDAWALNPRDAMTLEAWI
jgi:hypothetical protein